MRVATGERHDAAVLLFEAGRLNLNRIAVKLGVKYNTVQKWFWKWRVKQLVAEVESLNRRINFLTGSGGRS